MNSQSIIFRQGVLNFRAKMREKENAEKPHQSRLFGILLVSSGGFEPPAYRLGGGRSIQLSYEDKDRFVPD